MLPLPLEFRYACTNKSDINEHCPLLASLASIHPVVVELGVRYGVSTIALLAGRPKSLTSYDIRCQIDVDKFQKLNADENTQHDPKTVFEFIEGDSLRIHIPHCDLLFIDTFHTTGQLLAELTRHAPKVSRTIALHDTETFAHRGEDGNPLCGLREAIATFLVTSEGTLWQEVKHYTNNNGLTILTRKAFR
jgi:hypothetical protein